MTGAASLPWARIVGQGDTALFLLHGVGGGAHAWHDNQDAWAGAGYRSLAWDCPGYGRSAPVDPCTMDSLARALLALIDSAEARCNIVIGHSMGGMIAQEAVALAPQAIQGLVLSGTSPSFGPPGGNWQQQFLADRFAPLDAGAGMVGLAQDLVPAMMAPGAGPAAQAAARALMAQVPEATYRAALQAIVAFNRREELSRITVPTLCLAGEFDRNAPDALMQRMARQLPRGEHRCLSGVGHLANMEDPAAFNQAVLDFLHRHFPVGGTRS